MVTTVLTRPRSGNVIDGQSICVKTAGKAVGEISAMKVLRLAEVVIIDGEVVHRRKLEE